MEQIKNAIVKGLNEYLGVNIVPTDTTAPRPAYPYMSYKITTMFGEVKGSSRTSQIIPSSSQVFEYDVLVTQTEQPQTTLSISSYSLKDDEACALCLKAADWFKLLGYDYLKELGAVVVSISNIGDRTVQISDEYESRYVFDVRIRSIREIRKTVETIENYRFNHTVSG